MQISEKLSRFFQGTAITIALGMLTVGTFAYATPPQPSEEVPQPSLYHDMIEGNPECAIVAPVRSSNGMYFSVMNAEEEAEDAPPNFWSCVLNDSAPCNWFQNGLCVTAAFLIVIAIYALISLAVIKALAQEAIRKKAKEAVKKVVMKIKAIISKWKKTSITVAGVTINIPWGNLADYLDGTTTGKVIDFILLNDISKATRICKCLTC